jgi:hypothetical protein
MAWARGKLTDCYPVIGGTSVGHLKENIEVGDFRLSRPLHPLGTQDQTFRRTDQEARRGFAFRSRFPHERVRTRPSRTEGWSAGLFHS